MLTLYYTPHTCALATHIALEEAGAAYKLVKIDFKKAEQRNPAFLALNPKGRVPALVTGSRRADRNAGAARLCGTDLSEGQLAPLDDPFAFAGIQAFNSYMCSTVHVAHAHGMRGYRWADDPAAIAEMKRKVPDSLSACYEPIETGFLKGPWVMGDTYTIADAYLFTIAQWLEDDGVDPARFPRILEHRQRVASRPAVKRAARAGGRVTSRVQGAGLPSPSFPENRFALFRKQVRYASIVLLPSTVRPTPRSLPASGCPARW